MCSFGTFVPIADSTGTREVRHRDLRPDADAELNERLPWT